MSLDQFRNIVILMHEIHVITLLTIDQAMYRICKDASQCMHQRVTSRVYAHCEAAYVGTSYYLDNVLFK